MSRHAHVAGFDSKLRSKFVTGFRKRKLQRQKVGKEQQIRKMKAERSMLKKERNKAIYGDLEKLQKEWDLEAAATAVSDDGIFSTAVQPPRSLLKLARAVQSPGGRVHLADGRGDGADVRGRRGGDDGHRRALRDGRRVPIP